MVTQHYHRLGGPAADLRWSLKCVSHSVMSNSLRPHGLQPARLLCPWDSPSKDTGVGCHALLRGIFPTKGSNPGLLHCGQIHYCLSHQGSHLYTLRGVGDHVLCILNLNKRKCISGSPSGRTATAFLFLLSDMTSHRHTLR